MKEQRVAFLTTASSLKRRAGPCHVVWILCI